MLNYCFGVTHVFWNVVKRCGVSGGPFVLIFLAPQVSTVGTCTFNVLTHFTTPSSTSSSRWASSPSHRAACRAPATQSSHWNTHLLPGATTLSALKIFARLFDESAALHHHQTGGHHPGLVHHLPQLACDPHCGAPPVLRYLEGRWRSPSSPLHWLLDVDLFPRHKVLNVASSSPLLRLHSRRSTLHKQDCP